MTRHPRLWPIGHGVAWLLAAVALAAMAGRWIPALDLLNSIAPISFAAAAATLAYALWRRRPGMAVPALIAVALGAIPILHEATRPIPAAAAGEDGVTIVTHNVRFDNAHPRATAAILEAAAPDVIVLQETDRRGWAAQFSRARYPYRSACRAAGCSLLILSRWPIVASRYRIRDATTGEQVGPRLVWATIAPPGRRRFDVATVHLDWPGPAQQRQREELARSIGNLDLGRLVLTGDFNLTPWSWAMRRSDTDLAPLTRVTRATWSYPARIGSGIALPMPLLPIDQVFAGPAWSVAGVDRLERTGSDHYPVRVRLVARTR